MLTVHDLRFAYTADAPVLRDIDLTIHDGDIICLLGPSGCGKTTLMRLIAGLEVGYDGRIMFDDADLREMPVHERGFGLMFQDFALFPHLSVAENIRYGLRMQGKAKRDHSAIIADMLELVGLAGYGNRDISELSGGEKQRVALARSLAPQPQLLMLDEPLGSLDAGLRERLVVDLRRIIKRIGLTAIYVTHDQQEAYAVADHIAVMNAGRIEQIDTPQAIYRQPNTEFVARFLGMSNIVAGDVLSRSLGSVDYPKDQPVLLHPESITIAEHGAIAATVDAVLFRGGTTRLSVSSELGNLTFSVAQQGDTLPHVGDTIRLAIDEDRLVALNVAIAN